MSDEEGKAKAKKQKSDAYFDQMAVAGPSNVESASGLISIVAKNYLSGCR